MCQVLSPSPFPPNPSLFINTEVSFSPHNYPSHRDAGSDVVITSWVVVCRSLLSSEPWKAGRSMAWRDSVIVVSIRG